MRTSRSSLRAPCLSLITTYSCAYPGCGQRFLANRPFSQQPWLRALRSSTVLAWARGDGPASMRRGMRPSSWASAAAGVGQGGAPLRLALGGGQRANATGQRAQKRLCRHAHAHCFPTGGEGHGQVAAGAQHERQGARPVTLDQGLGHWAARPVYNRPYLLCVSQQDRQRLVAWTLLHCEQPVDGRGIATQTDKPIDGIGWHADDCGPAPRQPLPSRSAPTSSAASTTVINSAPIEIVHPHAKAFANGGVGALAKAWVLISAFLCPVYTTDG